MGNFKKSWLNIDQIEPSPPAPATPKTLANLNPTSKILDLPLILFWLPLVLPLKIIEINSDHWNIQ